MICLRVPVSILLGQWITLEERVLCDELTQHYVSILLGQWITLEARHCCARR